MQRYNIFNQLHKGLEAMLSDTVRMLQQTDFAVVAEAHATLTRINRFLRLMTDQAYLEDIYLLPLIETAAPATAYVLEQDHHNNGVAIKKVKAVLAVYEQATTTAEKIYAGKILINVFTELMILSLRHLSKEENMVNTVLWTNFTDEHIFHLEQDMMTYIPPEDLSIYNFWTTQHLDAVEMDNWLMRLEEVSDRETFHEMAAFADHELVLRRGQHAATYIESEALVA